MQHLIASEEELQHFDYPLFATTRMVLSEFLKHGYTVEVRDCDISKKESIFAIYDQDKQLATIIRNVDSYFFSPLNSSLGSIFANDKELTSIALRTVGLPQPQTIAMANDNNAVESDLPPKPWVVKPVDGRGGEGITAGIQDTTELPKAIEHARQISDRVLVQQQVPGDDYRLLFINFELAAAVKRLPPTVMGDGKQTIRELMTSYNSQERNEQHQGTRTKIDEVAVERFLEQKGGLDIVPKAGESVLLLQTANLSRGGRAIDMTDHVNADLAAKISNLLQTLQLQLCGVDVHSADISAPLEERSSYILELNGAPGLRMHEYPSEGTARPVTAQLVEALIDSTGQKSK